MTILPLRLRSRTPHLPTAPAPAPAAAPPAEPAGGCGWFESSLDLRQGLAVSEWPAEQRVVAALYFPQAAPCWG